MNPHEASQRLIPWYVNGTLNAPDMATVEQHIKACAQCEASVAAELQTAQRLHQEDDGARLEGILKNRDQQFERLRENLSKSRPRHFTPTRRVLVPALAAVALITMLVPALILLRPADPALFELKTTATNQTSPVLQLVFRPDTSEQDIELLLNASGNLLGAPSPSGVYRIALTTDDADALLARVRQHPAVRFAAIEL